MERQIISWNSPSLNKDMPMAIYGHYGMALLLIPTAGADYLVFGRPVTAASDQKAVAESIVV